MAINQFRAMGERPAPAPHPPRPLPAPFVRALARTEAQALKDILVEGSTGPGEARSLANARQGGAMADVLDNGLLRRMRTGRSGLCPASQPGPNPALPAGGPNPECDTKPDDGSRSLVDGSSPARGPGQGEEAARRAQAAQDDLIRANAIYAEMAAARRKAVAEAQALLEKLQADLFQIWSEVYLYRQKIFQKVADQWEKLLLDAD